ncbi:NosD domain-containing protein, partial [Methanococcus maripaludis]|uniref:NosD domain-containing protein n=1 Tax=Methanococcus maripaludis TaxID=39152 RepID=UPI0016187F96
MEFSTGYVGGTDIYFNNVNNSFITNNTLESDGLGKGIRLDYSNNNNITDNNASLNNQGIWLISSSNNTITGNNADSNSYYGISLKSSLNNTLTNNTANSNSYYGIYLESSSNYNTLTNNTADSNSDFGIYLMSSSNYNTLTNNTADSNSDYGILLTLSSNYNTLTNNTADSNSYYGIYLISSSNNTITGNNADSNSYYGIALTSSSNNTITGNNADSNSDFGIYLISSSNYNKIYNNIFNNSNNCYIVSCGLNYWNTSKEQGGGNYWFTPTGTGWSETHSDLNNDGFCDEQYGLYADNIDYLPKSLDTIAPEVTFNSPVNESIYNTSLILINVSAIDSSDVSSVTAEIENVKNVTLSLNGSYYTGNTGNLLDGVYNITVTSKDENGNTNTTEPVIVTIDTTAPKVIINHAEDDFNRTTNILNVTINDLSLDTVIAEINNGTTLENITLSETNGYFGNPDFEFVEGAYSVRIYANDSFGLVNSSETVDFMADLTKPEVSIETSVNGSIINTKNPILNFTITDNLCESVICNITVNGVTVNSSELNTSILLNYTLTLDEGENNISIIVTDDSGNIGENTTTVLVDTTAPQIVFNNVLPAYGYNSSILNVTVIDSTGVTVKANIMYAPPADTINLTNDSGYFGNSTYEFSEGINWVVVYAKDAAGNSNSLLPLLIRVDITNPEVSIETANLSASKELTINVTVTDVNPNGTNISIVDALTGELINSTLGPMGGSYNVTLTVPADGIYNVTANATDLAGNSNITEPITVTVDITNPSVVINNGFGPYSYNSSILNISVSDFTPVSVIAEINAIENITLVNISGYFVNSDYEFSEGSNTVKIYANDSFGHMNSSENITFKIDLNLPVITVKTVEGEYFNNGSNVLNFSVDEDYIDSVTAFNGSTEILLNNSTGNYLNSAELADGVYNITMTTNDTAGNTVNKTVSFTVDTVNPEITINTVEKSYSHNSSILNVSVSDI